MADQDFKLNVITTADTSGIRQTSAELDKLKNQQKDFLAGGPAQTGVEKFIAARQAAAAAAASAAKIAPSAAPIESAGESLGGTAIGIGTIIYSLTRAVTAMKEFNEEQNRIVDGMIKNAEVTRELGLAVADTLEAMKSAERIDTEPLEVSFQRLTGDVVKLKTELKLAFEANQFDDAKKYISQLGVVESQLNRVSMALYRKAEASRKSSEDAQKDADASAREEESFLKGAVKTTGPQVQAALRQEEAARRAAATGDERSAEQFRKSSEAFQRGMTPDQSEEFKQLREEMARMNVSLQMILETFR